MLYKEVINVKWLEQGYIGKLRALKDREAIQVLQVDEEPVVVLTQTEYFRLLTMDRMINKTDAEPVAPGSREEMLARAKQHWKYKDDILSLERWPEGIQREGLGIKLSKLLRVVGAGSRSKSPVDEWLETAYQNGLLRKEELEAGKYYFGRCRNASVAKWDGQKFWYIRSKFGSRFAEDINHPADDNGSDLFLAVGELEPWPDEEVAKVNEKDYGSALPGFLPAGEP